jgi:hypothetical protein
MDQAFIGSCASIWRRRAAGAVPNGAGTRRGRGRAYDRQQVNVDSSSYELYPIPCVKKRTGKIVRVAKRLYHLLLKYFYHPRYHYAVCAYHKVYPTSLSLSREVYPILVHFPFIQKYQHDNKAVSCQTICDKVSHGNKLDILPLTDQGEVYIVE